VVSTFTPNIQLEEPARGDDVGTWDTPVNSNTSVLDSALGAITTIPLNNSNIVLTGAQFQSENITFNSTLTGSVQITFPTSFKKPYSIGHLCTGSSAFTITLATTAAGGQAICCPPGETIDCFNDGTNIKFKNLGRVGGYWDYAGSSVPAWVSGCTVPPYLNCDGSVIASSIFPLLPLILGSSLLPDTRGRARVALDQGAGRISSAVFSSSLVGGTGGSQTVTLGTSNLPPYTPAGTIFTNGAITQGFAAGGVSQAAVKNGQGNVSNNDGTVIPSTFTGTAQGGVSAPVTVIQPSYIGGLTLIRAG
jgi:hypothetical protein